MSKSTSIIHQVYLLDEAVFDVTVDKHATGQQAFDQVCQHLNIVEKDYFGLRYHGTNYRDVWVRLDKQLHKQFPKDKQLQSFKFGVKFYPTDPSFLKEEITKYQLCLQVREDLLTGKLPCPFDTLAMLSSYWLQSEFGDASRDSPEVRQCMALLRETSRERSMPGFDERVVRLYESRKGMGAADADLQFLRLASQLPLYGVHKRWTKNTGGTTLIGVGAAGLVEVVGTLGASVYKWRDVKNINFKRNEFYVKLLPSSGAVDAKKRSILKRYVLEDEEEAKAMWRSCVDHHVFFRLTIHDAPAPSSAQKPDISKKRKLSSFRLSFRKKKPKTEAEVRKDSAKIARPNPTVTRSSSLRKSVNFASSEDEAQDQVVEEKLPVSQSTPQPSEPDPVSLAMQKINDDVSAINTGADKDRERFLIDKHDAAPAETQASANKLSQASDLAEDSHRIQGEKCSSLLNEMIVKEDDSVHASPITKQKTVVVIEPTPDDIIAPEAIAPEDVAETCLVAADSLSRSEGSSPCSEQQPSTPPQTPTSPRLAPPLIRQETREAVLRRRLLKFDDTNVLSDVEDSGDERESEIKLSIPSTPTPRKDESNVVTSEIKVSVQLVDDPTKNDRAPADADTADEVSADGAQAPESKGDDEIALMFPTTSRRKDNGYDATSTSADDDTRTLGGMSAVAVLGDDDPCVGDLENLEDCEERTAQSDKSAISPSSESSMSDITDNTETLCDPNILTVLLCRSAHGADLADTYQQLFGVSLRKRRGRQQHKPISLQPTRSIGVQVPDVDSPKEETPIFANEKALSWVMDEYKPIDDSSPELTHEAMRAALDAHRDITRITIPGIPDFVQTVILEEEMEIANEEDEKREEAVKEGLLEEQKRQGENELTAENEWNQGRVDDGPKDPSEESFANEQQNDVPENKLTKIEHVPETIVDDGTESGRGTPASDATARSKSSSTSKSTSSFPHFVRSVYVSDSDLIMSAATSRNSSEVGENEEFDVDKCDEADRAKYEDGSCSWSEEEEEGSSFEADADADVVEDEEYKDEEVDGSADTDVCEEDDDGRKKVAQVEEEEVSGATSSSSSEEATDITEEEEEEKSENAEIEFDWRRSPEQADSLDGYDTSEESTESTRSCASATVDSTDNQPDVTSSADNRCTSMSEERCCGDKGDDAHSSDGIASRGETRDLETAASEDNGTLRNNDNVTHAASDDDANASDHSERMCEYIAEVD